MIVSSDLSCISQVASTVKKVNGIVGLFKRTVGFSRTSIFSTLYKSLVRLVLEYAAPVCSPLYLVKNMDEEQMCSKKSVENCRETETRRNAIKRTL